jgi:hypothetical protein
VDHADSDSLQYDGPRNVRREVEIRVVNRLQTQVLRDVDPNPKLEPRGGDRELTRVVLGVCVLLNLVEHNRGGVIRLLDNQTEDLGDVVTVLGRQCLVLVRLRVFRV